MTGDQGVESGGGPLGQRAHLGQRLGGQRVLALHRGAGQWLVEQGQDGVGAIGAKDLGQVVGAGQLVDRLQDPLVVWAEEERAEGGLEILVAARAAAPALGRAKGVAVPTEAQ